MINDYEEKNIIIEDYENRGTDSLPESQNPGYGWRDFVGNNKKKMFTF